MKKKYWESTSCKNSKDRSCMWAFEVCVFEVSLAILGIPSLGRYKYPPLLHKIPTWNPNPEVHPRESVSPWDLLTEHGWEGIIAEVWVTPRQPHWTIFTQHGWSLLYSHIDEPFLLTFPSLYTLAPLELCTIPGKQHTNSLEGWLESWVTLCMLSFYSGRWTVNRLTVMASCKQHRWSD